MKKQLVIHLPMNRCAKIHTVNVSAFWEEMACLSEIYSYGKSKTLGKVNDYFATIEYQNRGSSHLHIFLWIEDAPAVHQSSIHNLITRHYKLAEYPYLRSIFLTCMGCRPGGFSLTNGILGCLKVLRCIFVSFGIDGCVIVT